MNKTNYLIDMVKSSKYLQAASHHKSAKSKSMIYLADLGIDPCILDAWGSCGKQIIEFYSARLTLNNKNIDNVSSCSITSKTLKKILTEQFSKIVKESEISIFGFGVSTNEREDIRSYHNISHQIIGAYSHENNLQLVFSELFNKILEVSDIIIKIGKDSKTTLQEHSQKYRKKAPSYNVLTITGPAHNQTFEVQLELMGQKIIGIGKSKKLAEKDAANKFIEKNKIADSTLSVLDLSNFVNFKNLAINKSTNYNYAKINKFCDRHKFPKNNIDIIILAMKHRSSSLKIKNIKLGENNSILAFIGSLALTCLAQQMVIREMTQQKLLKLVGLAPLVAKLISLSSIARYYDTLSINEIAILGQGETLPHENLKSEFIQALCGALYLINESTESNEIPLQYKLSIVSTLIENDLKDIENIDDDPLFSKMFLQERCQSLGLKIAYNTEINKEITDPDIKTTSSIRIESERIDEALIIERNNTFLTNEIIPKKSILESEITIKLKNYFDAIYSDIKNNLTKSNNSEMDNKIKGWIWKDMESFVRSFKENKNFKQKNKIIESNFLGLCFLKKKDFHSFEFWMHELKFIYSQRFSDIFIENLGKLYESASHTKVSNNKNNLLQENILELENELSKADPLTPNLDFRNTNSFISLVKNATILKLKGGEICKIKISEIIYETNLINKRVKNNVTLIGDDIDVLEIKGTHLLLLEQLIKLSCDGDIKITSSNESLSFSINNKDTPFQNNIKKDPIWITLKNLLPILEIKSGENSLDIYTASIIHSSNREMCLRLWFNYINQGDAEINSMLATMLHSIKNDILGFTYASAHALKEESIRNKYQLASDASSHIEQAISRLRVIRNILKDTSPLQIEPLRIDLVMKSIITDIWSWVPNSITLSFPPNNETSTIWTSSDNLNSIIINLVKNSVDAMNGIGNIDIMYDIDPDFFNISFTIVDTGPGFSSFQIESLNAGTPINTSKKDGQGIGLLTVILLVKQLNGTMKFSNTKTGGGCAEVWIPSLPSEIIEGL